MMGGASSNGRNMFSLLHSNVECAVVPPFVLSGPYLTTRLLDEHPQCPCMVDCQQREFEVSGQADAARGC